MLLLNPHKTVLPKLGFFQAIILMKSLGNQVVHAFGFLADFLNSYGMNTKSVLFLQYDGIPGKKIVVWIHSSASVTFLQNHSTPPLHCRMTNSRPFTPYTLLRWNHQAVTANAPSLKPIDTFFFCLPQASAPVLALHFAFNFADFFFFK